MCFKRVTSLKCMSHATRMNESRRSYAGALYRPPPHLPPVCTGVHTQLNEYFLHMNKSRFTSERVTRIIESYPAYKQVTSHTYMRALYRCDTVFFGELQGEGQGIRGVGICPRPSRRVRTSHVTQLCVGAIFGVLFSTRLCKSMFMSVCVCVRERKSV